MPAVKPQRCIKRLRAAMQVIAYCLGALVVGLAITVYFSDDNIRGIYHWLDKVFSLSFISLFVALVMITLYSAWRIGADAQPRYWHEVGQQAAAGIATLALTFTLLGISLGIGSLADQNISPESIQQIIQGLTKHFSMAFMTTVVGLPTANALRALVALRFIAYETAEEARHKTRQNSPQDLPQHSQQVTQEITTCV